MTALVDLQRQMMAAIREPGLMPGGVFQPDHLPEDRPMSVYVNHHRISLCGALATTFSTVSLLTGEEAFRALASLFLQRHPPLQPCLAEYGAAFGSYLDGESMVKSLPYLADMARLDWAINRAATAPDAVALDGDQLGTLSPDELAELPVKAHPSLTLLSSTFPLPDIYRLAHGAGDAEAIKLDSKGARLMVWRRHNAPMTASVSWQTFEALKVLARGGSILSACEQLSQAELPEFFGRYLLAGGFVKHAPLDRPKNKLGVDAATLSRVQDDMRDTATGLSASSA